jgi:hypothetical protein
VTEYSNLSLRIKNKNHQDVKQKNKIKITTKIAQVLKGSPTWGFERGLLR